MTEWRLAASGILLYQKIWISVPKWNFLHCIWFSGGGWIWPALPCGLYKPVISTSQGCIAMFIPIKGLKVSRKNGANGPTATPFARVPENSSLILYSQKLPSEGRWYLPTCVTPAIRGAILHQIRSFFEHCSKSLWPPPPLRFEHHVANFFWWIS